MLKALDAEITPEELDAGRIFYFIDKKFALRSLLEDSLLLMLGNISNDRFLIARSMMLDPKHRALSVKEKFLLQIYL